MADETRRKVYLLEPRRLSPETIAVTFAKTSRSPLSFREIAEELSDEQSAAFHEKWVVGYGHASVAEHAVLHIAFENVSRLAIESIESNRLASYTEKSTRYQRWDPDDYYVPDEVRSEAFEGIYRETCDALFQAYLASLEPVRSVVQRANPRREGESDEKWDGRLRSRYVDACRFLLPAAALANVGMTANARVLEHAIGKMLAHPLDEVRRVGEETKAATKAEVPTLLKYADPLDYVRRAEAQLSERLRGSPPQGAPPEAGDPVRLVRRMPDTDEAVLAAALYSAAGESLGSLLARVSAMSPGDKSALAADLLAGRGAHDAPVRALEHTVFTFDVVLDQGAYFELKRHRMMTQTPQSLTTRLGYAVPRLMVEAGFLPDYEAAMKKAAEAFEALAGWNHHVAAYLVPNGYRRRVALTMNLREAFHFCELRSAANAHFSIRRIALRMAEILRAEAPLLAEYLRLPGDVTWKQIEDEHFERA